MSNCTSLNNSSEAEEEGTDEASARTQWKNKEVWGLIDDPVTPLDMDVTAIYQVRS